MKRLPIFLHFAFVLVATSLVACSPNSNTATVPDHPDSPALNAQPNTAYFGGGCFWCVEAVFQRIKGVTKVESGYAGGTVANPTYKQVTSGTTGHAEVAAISYDPAVISYKELLYVFLRTHNPTTLNRQGNDVGTQYRSIVLYQTEAEKAAAEAAIQEAEAAKAWDDPIVTELTRLKAYYPAEDYHQNYYNDNRDKNPYCTFVIDPKIRKLYKDEALKPYVQDK